MPFIPVLYSVITVRDGTYPMGFCFEIGVIWVFVNNIDCNSINYEVQTWSHYITTTTLYPLNGLISRTTRVSRHQKGKPFWILLEQQMMGWQWHQLDHMQITRTSLQTDDHASTSPLSVYRLNALPATKPTASKHWRQQVITLGYCK